MFNHATWVESSKVEYFLSIFHNDMCLKLRYVGIYNLVIGIRKITINNQDLVYKSIHYDSYKLRIDS